MINAVGYQGLPAESNHLMYSHPGYREVLASFHPARAAGETGESLVVCLAGNEKTAKEDHYRLCQNNMVAYKCPVVYEFTDSIPKSPTARSCGG